MTSKRKERERRREESVSERWERRRRRNERGKRGNGVCDEPFVSFATFVCFSFPSVRTPSNRRSMKPIKQNQESTDSVSFSSLPIARFPLSPLPPHIPPAEEDPKALTLHLQLRVNIHSLPHVTQHVSNQPISPAHRRVDLGSNSNQSSRDGEREIVVLGVEGDDLGENGSADEFSVGVLVDESGSDLDFLLELEEERKGRGQREFVSSTRLVSPTFVVRPLSRETRNRLRGKEGIVLTLSTPFKIDPPATPPFKSSTSEPGLLTSNERMMIILGDEVKSLGGTGI